MAGQINISGAVDAVQLHGNDSYTVARDFTFPDESGELLVNNGNPTFESVNSGPLAGLRNLIINPFAKINQRGDQTSFTDQRYCADRWRWAGNGSTISVYSLSPIDLGAVSDGLIDLTGQDYRQRVVVNSGTNDASVDQRIEGVNTLIPGQQYTESIYVRSTTAQSLTLGYRYRFGTGSTTPQQQYGGSAISVPADTWTRITHTFTAADRPATQDLKEDNATDIFVSGIQGFCELSGWQLEPGPVATPVEQRPISMELSLCERYFALRYVNIRWNSMGPSDFHEQAINYSMRVMPSVINTTNTASNMTLNFGAVSHIGCRVEGVAIAAGDAYSIAQIIHLDAEL